MTVMDFFGCACLAFGPPLAMFTFTIAAEPIRIIILIASAFFWLISLLLSSILWYAVVPLQEHLAFGLVFSVLFQEGFRYLLYWVLRKAERGLEKVTTTHVADSRHIFAYVCGLGFGFMSGAFALVNVLADAVGPGTMGLRQDKKNWGQIVWVVGSHLIVSCMTLLNRYQAYAASLLSAYIVLVITTTLAFKIAGGRMQTLIHCFQRN
ncbi:hypothetical protein P5V15_001928 [Pogonomyrmex californicus]